MADKTDIRRALAQLTAEDRESLLGEFTSEGPRCWWCDDVAEFYCDTMLLPKGMEPGSVFPNGYTNDPQTCDAAMCPGHALETMRGHLTIGGVSEVMTSHQCPFCQAADLNCLRSVPVDEHRAEVRAHGWRARLEVVR